MQNEQIHSTTLAKLYTMCYNYCNNTTAETALLINKDDAFKFGYGAGWYGLSVGIDIMELCKLLFGGA